MQSLADIFQRISHVGVSDNLAPAEVARIRTTNILILLGLLCTPLFFLIFYFQEMYALMGFMVLHWAFCAWQFRLNAIGRHLAALVFALVWSSLFVLTCSVLIVGHEASEFILAALTTIPLYTVSRKHKKVMYGLCAFLAALCFLSASEVLSSFGIYKIEPHVMSLLQLSNVGVLLCLMFGQMISFQRESESYREVFKKQEREIQMRAKMSDIGMMAAGMAHEINNPLTSISLATDTVADIVEELPKSSENSEIQKMADYIRACVNRIESIVHGLKHVSRDGNEDPFEETRILDVIDDVVAICRPRLNRENIDLQINRPSLDVLVSGQAASLSQVFINLVANAMDAVHEYDKKWIRIAGREREGFIEVLVTDCGPGLSEEVLQKIMSPFFTTKEVGEGTGLGLSISHGIVAAHKGELSVNPQAGNTEFVLRLPLSVINREESELSAA